jgi:hypothetical protein
VRRLRSPRRLEPVDFIDAVVGGGGNRGAN